MQRALLSCKAPARSKPAALSIIFLKSIYDECCKPNVPSLQTIAKMSEECITHTELNAHQSNLNIDFLLLSKTFLPVGVAYKKTDNHGFS